MVDFLGKAWGIWNLFLQKACAIFSSKFWKTNINQLYIAKILTLLSSCFIILQITELKYFEKTKNSLFCCFPLVLCIRWVLCRWQYWEVPAYSIWLRLRNVISWSFFSHKINPKHKATNVTDIITKNLYSQRIQQTCNYSYRLTEVFFLPPLGIKLRLSELVSGLYSLNSQSWAKSACQWWL